MLDDETELISAASILDDSKGEFTLGVSGISQRRRNARAPQVKLALPGSRPLPRRGLQQLQLVSS
jgi:hypothetical protein